MSSRTGHEVEIDYFTDGSWAEAAVAVESPMLFRGDDEPLPSATNSRRTNSNIS